MAKMPIAAGDAFTAGSLLAQYPMPPMMAIWNARQPH
jgi:hypothetical protein